MRIVRFKMALCVGLACFMLAACSVNLAKYDLQDYPKTLAFFEPISLSFNGHETYLENNLQRAYTAAVDTVSYPMESCRGVAHITASVTDDAEKSLWGIGAAFIPFWPVLPVSETWHYHMETRIFCNGTLTFKGEFDESEHVEAVFYGKMRSDLVNAASQEMHRKLLERLRYETHLGRAADLNVSRDY